MKLASQEIEHISRSGWGPDRLLVRAVMFLELFSIWSKLVAAHLPAGFTLATLRLRRSRQNASRPR
jgi:hypothetical protein